MCDGYWEFYRKIVSMDCTNDILTFVFLSNFLYEFCGYFVTVITLSFPYQWNVPASLSWSQIISLICTRIWRFLLHPPPPPPPKSHMHSFVPISPPPLVCDMRTFLPLFDNSWYAHVCTRFHPPPSCVICARSCLLSAALIGRYCVVYKSEHSSLITDL